MTTASKVSGRDMREPYRPGSRPPSSVVDDGSGHACEPSDVVDCGTDDELHGEARLQTGEERAGDVDALLVTNGFRHPLALVGAAMRSMIR